MLPNRRSLVVQQYADTFDLNITHSPSRSSNRVVKEASLCYLMIETSFFFCLRWRSRIIVEKDVSGFLFFCTCGNILEWWKERDGLRNFVEQFPRRRSSLCLEIAFFVEGRCWYLHGHIYFVRICDSCFGPQTYELSFVRYHNWNMISSFVLTNTETSLLAYLVFQLNNPTDWKVVTLYQPELFGLRWKSG